MAQVLLSLLYGLTRWSSEEVEVVPDYIVAVSEVEMSMHEGTNAGSKVVSLFQSRSPVKPTGENSDDLPTEESFDDVMRRNADVKERLRKERLKANQAVLRSYKIKN